MAYADLLDDESIESQYLVVLKPTIYIPETELTDIAPGNPGNVTFTASFPYSRWITHLRIGSNEVFSGDAEASGGLASDENLTDGVFYIDTENDLLYHDQAIKATPLGLFIQYEIHLATYDAKWYRNPTSTTTTPVYWEPLITSSPAISQSSTEEIFGFMPATSGSIEVSNATQFLQQHLYRASFSNAPIQIYHWLDELDDGNVKLVMNAVCGGRVRFNDRSTTIPFFDNRITFNSEFRHSAGDNFYTTTSFANVDPDFEEKPIRKVFGVVDKFIPVNIDYNDDAPTGTNNRDWACINPHNNLCTIAATVSSSPTSTTTRTYVDDADGLRVGDTVHIDKSTDEYMEITAVNKTGSHYIEHIALVSGAASSGDTVNRAFIGSVSIKRNGIPPLKLFYKRDYDVYTNSGAKVAGFTLNDNFEEPYRGDNELIGSFNYFDDGTVTTPVDGTGGAQDKLTMTYSNMVWRLNKATGDAQGQGVSMDFGIPTNDRYKQYYLKFQYKTNEDSIYDDGDYAVWIYDVTNASIITPSVSDIPDGEGTFYATWTATDSTSYRFIIMCTVTESTAFDVDFTNPFLSAPIEPFDTVLTQSNVLQPSDLVYCRIYGHTNQETISASGFGSDSETTGNLAQGIVVLYSLMKSHLGIAEADIDTTTFSSLQGTNTDEVGFAIPPKNGDPFPTYREVIGQLLQTLILKFHMNDSGEYSLLQTGSLATVDKTLPVEELLQNTFEYEFDFTDVINDVTIEYAMNEVDSTGREAESYSRTTERGTLGLYLHQITKEMVIQSLHYDSTEAATFATKMLTIFQERRGKIRFRTKHRFFDSELNDTIRVSRPRMPGFAYTAGTDRDRDGAILSTSKRLTDIEIVLDDQKGIEDNSGSW